MTTPDLTDLDRMYAEATQIDTSVENCALVYRDNLRTYWGDDYLAGVMAVREMLLKSAPIVSAYPALAQRIRELEALCVEYEDALDYECWSKEDIDKLKERARAKL